MEEWQQRVVEEDLQLEDRRDKLAAFMSHPDSPYTRLPAEDRELLIMQFGAMTRLHTILQMRIRRFSS